MCVAVPGKLVAIQGSEGTVDLQGSRLPVNLTLVPEATLGAWVLVHAGFAIQEIDAQSAAETHELLRGLQGGRASSPTASAPDDPSASPTPASPIACRAGSSPPLSGPASPEPTP